MVDFVPGIRTRSKQSVERFSAANKSYSKLNHGHCVCYMVITGMRKTHGPSSSIFSSWAELELLASRRRRPRPRMLVTMIIVLLFIPVVTAGAATTDASVNTANKNVRGGNFMMGSLVEESQQAAKARSRDVSLQQRRRRRKLDDVEGPVVNKGERPPPIETPATPAPTPRPTPREVETPAPTTTAPTTLEPTVDAEEPVTEDQPSVSPVMAPTVEEGGGATAAENGNTEEDADPNNTVPDSSSVKNSADAATSSSMTENPIPKSMIMAVIAVVVVVSLVLSLVALRARHRRVEQLIKTGASAVGSSATAAAEIDYNDWDWEELPTPIRGAAMTLGYDERMWNVGHEPQVADTSWERLTPGEQEAARLLGYTQEKWDSE